MNLEIARSIQVGMAILMVAGPVARAQDAPHHKTPFSYDVTIGGMGPMGATSSGPYSSSFLIGGGASLPVGKWVSLDLATLDFGFGTTNETQTIQVSDGTRRTTRNYQMNFSSGARVNLPLGRGAALGLGGGYGAIVQNEYVPIRVANNGVDTVIQTVNCSAVCSQAAYQGPYLQARLFSRRDKFSGVGINAKYYMAVDANHPQGSFLRLPPQRWLSVGVTFSFGI